jgi:hypothetical protein
MRGNVRAGVQRFDPEATLLALARGELAGGDLDMLIDRQGRWVYRGSPIERMALVRLFASALGRAADGSYWLVTPFERWRVQVEDAPFLAVELERTGGSADRRLRFRTNIDEWVEVDDAHPLEMRDRGASGRVPYILLDRGLAARVTPAVFYELVDLAEPDPACPTTLGVRSAGRLFPLAHDLGEGDG